MIALRESERCALAGTDCRPPPLRRRASRPQLKRDPLGGTTLVYCVMAWASALPFASLSTTCKSGVRRSFEVRTEGVADPEGDSWIYYAKPVGTKLRDDEEYFASFKRIGPDLLQLEGVKNGLPNEYRGCGLTRALIIKVARQHSTRIRSSRHRPSEGETRTEAATAVWKSLVRNDLAFYDSAEDRFCYPMRPKGAA